MRWASRLGSDLLAQCGLHWPPVMALQLQHFCKPKTMLTCSPQRTLANMPPLSIASFRNHSPLTTTTADHSRSSGYALSRRVSPLQERCVREFGSAHRTWNAFAWDQALQAIHSCCISRALHNRGSFLQDIHSRLGFSLLPLLVFTALTLSTTDLTTEQTRLSGQT